MPMAGETDGKDRIKDIRLKSQPGRLEGHGVWRGMCDQVKKVSNDELRSEKMVQRKAIQLEGPCVKAPCAQEEQKELSLQPASWTSLHWDTFLST